MKNIFGDSIQFRLKCLLLCCTKHLHRITFKPQLDVNYL